MTWFVLNEDMKNSKILSLKKTFSTTSYLIFRNRKICCLFFCSIVVWWKTTCRPQCHSVSCRERRLWMGSLELHRTHFLVGVLAGADHRGRHPPDFPVLWETCNLLQLELPLARKNYSVQNMNSFCHSLIIICHSSTIILVLLTTRY